MAKGKEAFSTFIQGVLGRITDPTQRTAAEGLVTQLSQIEPLVSALGDGVAGQSEIDRQLQDLRTQRTSLETQQEQLDEREQRLQGWHGDLSKWYTDNQELVRRGKAAAPGSPDPLKPEKPVIPPGVLTEDAWNERIAQERAGVLGFTRDTNQLMRDHFSKFQEIVDIDPLLQHPKIRELGLIGVYEQVHKDRLDKWKADATAAAEEKIRADERQKVQASMASMPYPSPTGAGSGSPLDALTVGKPDSLTDAAVAHYNRLQAERAGAATR